MSDNTSTNSEQYQIRISKAHAQIKQKDCILAAETQLPVSSCDAVSRLGTNAPCAT
jgi:hypothetical protein